jgi:hypothetical protein
MSVEIAGVRFATGTYKNHDMLGYLANSHALVACPQLASWGLGDDYDQSRSLPISLSHTPEAVPSSAQQAAFEWLMNQAEAAATRLERLIENAWKECYFGDHRPTDDEVMHHIESIAISPRENPCRASKIVFAIEQDWEVEHGFYLILDPENPSGDAWCWWDGLDENDVSAGYDEDGMAERLNQTVDQALAAGDVQALSIIASIDELTKEQANELLILAIADLEEVLAMNLTMMGKADSSLRCNRKYSPLDESWSAIDLAQRMLRSLEGKSIQDGTPAMQQFVKQKTAEAIHEFGSTDAIERINRIIDDLTGDRDFEHDQGDDDFGLGSLFGTDDPSGKMFDEIEGMIQNQSFDQLRQKARGPDGLLAKMQQTVRDNALGLLSQMMTPDQRAGTESLPVDMEVALLQMAGDMHEHPAYKIIKDVDPHDVKAAHAAVKKIGGTGGSPWFETAEFAIDAGMFELFTRWVDAMPNINEVHHDRSLLHLAVLKIRPEMVRYLRGKEANFGLRVTMAMYPAPGVTAVELARDVHQQAEAMVQKSKSSSDKSVPTGVYDALQVRMRMEPSSEVARRTAEVLAACQE